MTPLELSVLLHYYITNERFPTSSARDEAELMFMDANMLEHDSFILTEKGIYFIDHILNTPFPATSYTIPQPDPYENAL